MEMEWCICRCKDHFVMPGKTVNLQCPRQRPFRIHCPELPECLHRSSIAVNCWLLRGNLPVVACSIQLMACSSWRQWQQRQATMVSVQKPRPSGKPLPRGRHKQKADSLSYFSLLNPWSATGEGSLSMELAVLLDIQTQHLVDKRQTQKSVSERRCL